MSDSKVAKTPMEAGLKLKKEKSIDTCDPKIPYQALIGCLLYIGLCTRPDIMYSVNLLSQFNTCYNQSHWLAAKRVLRYLKGTKDFCLTFNKTGNNIIGFVDADWGMDINDRRSYTGYAFKVGGGLVSWSCRK